MGTPPPPQGRWMESLQGSSSGDHKRVGKGKKCVWGLRTVCERAKDPVETLRRGISRGGL